MTGQIEPYLVLMSAYFGQKVTCLSKMKGGFSPADNYLLQVKEDKYVLRIFNRKSSAELRAAVAAADEGISPPVFWIADDESAYLMKYVEDVSFSIEIAKEPKNIAMIARSFRKIHGLSRKGIFHRSVYKELEEKYSKLKSLGFSSPKSDQAMSEVEQGYLAKVVREEDWVVIHGDLTPRNEFFDGRNLIIIDWDEANLENRFYDLSLFALMHNYTHSEEELLLKEYFKSPIGSYWDEYMLYKKINLLVCFVGATLFALHLDPEKQIQLDARLDRWATYIERFQNPDDSLSAQFFYDWGKEALNHFFNH